jgi:hypothetical protein
MAFCSSVFSLNGLVATAMAGRIPAGSVAGG